MAQIDGMVRMEYVGNSAGTIQFTNHTTGRTYSGGRNSLFQFIDVYPDDVNFLVKTGQFQKSSTTPDAKTAKAAPEAAPAPVEAVVPTVNTPQPIEMKDAEPGEPEETLLDEGEQPKKSSRKSSKE